MKSLVFFTLAALAEIGGCYSFFLYFRLDKSALWLGGGVILLVIFAGLLAFAPAATQIFAGRSYAAYGGIYIGMALMWLWLVEKQPPDRWDWLGAGLCLIGALVMIFAPGRGIR